MTKREKPNDKMNLTDMNNDAKNHQRINWVSDNREQRKKKKTFAEVLQSGYEKEVTFVFKQDINAVMNRARKEIYTVGKVTADISEIYNDLLKNEQNSFSAMPNFPPLICADTFTFKNESNIIIGSGCEFDVDLDEYNMKILMKG